MFHYATLWRIARVMNLDWHEKLKKTALPPLTEWNAKQKQLPVEMQTGVVIWWTEFESRNRVVHLHRRGVNRGKIRYIVDYEKILNTRVVAKR